VSWRNAHFAAWYLIVMMRPSQVVTVLHDRAKVLDEQSGGVGPEY